MTGCLICNKNVILAEEFTYLKFQQIRRESTPDKFPVVITIYPLLDNLYGLLYKVLS